LAVTVGYFTSDVNRPAGPSGRVSADLGLAILAKFRPGLGLGQAKIGKKTKSTKHALAKTDKPKLAEAGPSRFYRPINITFLLRMLLEGYFIFPVIRYTNQ